MGSFSAVVRIAVLVVYDRWHDLISGSTVTKFVGDHAPRCSAWVLKHLLKESRSGTRILMLLHKDIDNLIILIYRPPKITPFAKYGRDHDFIHKPRIAQASCTLSQSPRVRRTKLMAPEENGLVADHDAALGEEILDISEAEYESVVEP